MFPNNNDFDAEFTFENTAASIPDAPPFRVLLLGDWSGDLRRKDFDERLPVEIDRDNFDDVLKKLKVELDLDLQGDGKSALQLQFTAIDDFHPDNLFRNVSLFSGLRDVRRRLSNSDTFENAAKEVRSWFVSPDENFQETDEIQPQIEDVPPIDTNNLLDLILTQPGDSPSSVKLQTADNTELGRFVSKIVSPFLIKIDENEQSKLISAVDETISELMRAILHHPKFQALESAWRGLYFLVRRVELDSGLKVFILDISQEEITDNLKSVDTLADSFLYRQLLSESFSIIAGNYSFSLNVDDIAFLMRAGKIAEAAKAPFVSHIKPELFGVEEFSEKVEGSNFDVSPDSKELKLWTALRSSPEANFIGLSPMKILIRMPFGESTDSAETFSFEELKDKSKLQELLWTNPCFGIVFLLAQSYKIYGWAIRDNLLHDIENLPMYVYQKDGVMKTAPCGEIVLTETLLEKILEQGLIAFISFRDSNKLRLSRFQSISFSHAKLSRVWENL
jgi:type VI secretion system protein ImpC